MGSVEDKWDLWKMSGICRKCRIWGNKWDLSEAK